MSDLIPSVMSADFIVTFITLEPHLTNEIIASDVGSLVQWDHEDLSEECLQFSLTTSQAGGV